MTGPIDGRLEVTDDTQMTLFTAEGLIRAKVRGRAKGISHPASVARRAYSALAEHPAQSLDAKGRQRARA